MSAIWRLNSARVDRVDGPPLLTQHPLLLAEHPLLIAQQPLFLPQVLHGREQRLRLRQYGGVLNEVGLAVVLIVNVVAGLRRQQSA